ncbi:hypothetical protein [Metabacillus iocasae]|uniref:Uncharacterized protein n=1 Tax=Priestia iocasae TaxID=2291674 RepID=A0ABS2QUT0_9BACI|nr:hypothetical protein [Metabacillus iocasae]MBM7702481.1 hypothetical protein [Metabacillus iocasae]
MSSKAKLLIIGLLAVVILLLTSSPFWIWQLKPSTSIDMLIVDKTVPDKTFREHQGLTWFLNHEKVKKRDGATYDASVDYIGFNPTTMKEEPMISLQNREYDAVYVADGYGVYEDDLTTKSGKRSELVYGGMTAEDVATIRSIIAKQNSTLISEFNTFGSPTPDKVKKEFYNLHHLVWDGWIGRYFDDLQSSEVPAWMKQNYETQYGEKWSHDGEGFVFVHQSDELIVLTEEQVQASGVHFSYTKEGTSHFDLENDSTYGYWFDIVTPIDEKEVMATFTIDVTDEAKHILEEKGIPLTVPAIIYHDNPQYSSYYFTGDFADQGDLPSLYQTEWTPLWNKWRASIFEEDADAFYWSVYVPMMKKVVEKIDKQDKKVVQKEVEVEQKNGYSLNAKVGTDYLQVYKDGEWQDILVKGVNMGIGKPGSFPGETAISKQEYARWFKQIGEMNANAIRVYTIHPPHFYEALLEYNATATSPLYVFHGVWLNEEVFYETQDAFSDENTKEFKDEIKRIVDLVHGNATLEDRPGHASGSYTADVSPYIMGWLLGVEWDPEVVLATNDKHKGQVDFKGEYVYTKEAEPFEIWLAEMMEYTISYEQKNYQWQRPMSFTNWPTTDLLKHPAEPYEKEDMVSINPNVMYETDRFSSGLFASYHMYPYYPDFLNYESRYVHYVDHRGEKNNYAGYLQHMKETHRMPVLVAEFGIPASRGLTHRNVHGLDQGHHSEEEQGQMVTRLYEDIVQEKMAGGMIFSWHDEWFKRTWNTMDYDNPDRRPFWSNVQTNEQRFGLLSFEPGDTLKVKVDGKISDWKELNIASSYPKSKQLKGLYVTSDEAYVYVRLDTQNIESSNHYLLFNSIHNQGQSTIPHVPSLKAEGIDFIIELTDEQSSRMLVDSYYDTFYYSYGHVLKMINAVEYASKADNGAFHPIRLALNKKVTISQNGKQVTYPFDDYETGKLQVGNSDPRAKTYNSLADFYVDPKKQIVEWRIPWALLNVKDPSTREVMGDIWTKEGLDASEVIESIGIGVVAVDKKTNKVMDTYPSMSDEKLDELYRYKWDEWEQPTYHERLKHSYYDVQKMFDEINDMGE